MINKKQSPRIMAAKYLLVVPALAVALLAVQISGLQAEEISDNTLVEPTELSEYNIVEDVFFDQKDTTNSIVEKTVSMFTDTTIIKKEDNPYVILYGDPSAEMRPDSNVIAFRAKDSVVFRLDTSPSSKHALVLIDGIEGSVNDVSPQNIEKVEVLKGATAFSQYRSRGKNGVVVITTKRGKPDMKPYNFQHPYSQKGIFETPLSRIIPKETIKDRPLIILDGKIILNEDMHKIDPNSIESIHVLTNKTATDLYGEKGKDGVIIITSKPGTNPFGTQEAVKEPIPIETIPDYRIRQGTTYAPEGNNNLLTE